MLIQSQEKNVQRFINRLSGLIMYCGFQGACPLPERLAFPPPARLKLSMTDTAYHKSPEAVFEPEALLLRVGRQRDKAAFKALFSHYGPRVKSYLLKHGADDAAAEEAVQNTFVSVWEKAAAFDPARAAASTWIFTIARNKRIDALRREKFVEVNTDAPALAQAVAPAPESYADGGTVEKLNAAIDELPPEQAKLLRMAFFEDKSHSAISKETKLPLGTVKSRLRLALDRLRLRLKKEDA
jgi:RNA polymerase sigma factor (sigma-70 family)